MTDTRDMLIQAINKRLAEIEEKLDPFNALIDERAELLKILRRHQPLRANSNVIVNGNLWTVPFPGISGGILPNIVGTGHGVLGLDVEKPPVEEPSNGKRASATSIVVAEARHILENTNRRRMQYARLFEALPDSAKAAFKGKYVQQAVKTAIQRAGYKVGIEYTKGGIVKIIQNEADKARGEVAE